MEREGGPGLELVEADGETFAQRPTPWSEDIEISALGAMLIDADARAEALERLERDDFHRQGHRKVFDALRRLEERGVEGDVATLADELEAAGDLEAAGGMKYLAGLLDTPTSANLPHHADRLRELRALREVQDVAESLAWASTETGVGEVGAVLEDAREHLREIGERAGADAAETLRTARAILEDPDARKRPEIVATHLANLCFVTLVASREKTGKSTLLRWSAARVSAGLRMWGRSPVPEGARDVLYWGQERPVDIASELDAMGADLERVHVRDMRRLAGDRFAALRRDLDTVEPALLIVDTLSTFVDNMDLDPGSSADWEPKMNRFGALAQETETAVVLAHHARKSDGEYRDSTAIGASVDAILELRRDPAEGERVRKVTAKARSAVPVQDFSYTLAGDEDRPRLELLDGSLSLEERVQRFVADHQPCSQREVREGVRGQSKKIRNTLKELSEDGGPLVEDASSTPYQYLIRQTTGGTATEPGKNRTRTAGTDSRGRSGSTDPGAPVRGPGREPPAGSVGDEGEGGTEPNRCSECDRKVGPTSTLCARCKMDGDDDA